MLSLFFLMMPRSEVPLYLQVSRLGLWSRIVLACCFINYVFWSWDIVVFEIWRIYFIIHVLGVVYGLYVYVPLLCDVTWPYACMYCGLFEDVASISRICLYIRAFYRLLEIGCYTCSRDYLSRLAKKMELIFYIDLLRKKNMKTKSFTCLPNSQINFF
jgi:hypothetical protein